MPGPEPRTGYRGAVPFALALSVILAVVAVFQAALALAAPLGRFAWGGEHRILPPRLRVGSALSIVVYALIVTVAWNRVGAIDVFPPPVAEIAMWVVFAFFVLGGGMNAISRSRAERVTMVPVTLVLAGLSLLIAMGFGELATAI